VFLFTCNVTAVSLTLRTFLTDSVEPLSSAVSVAISSSDPESDIVSSSILIFLSYTYNKIPVARTHNSARHDRERMISKLRKLG